MSGNVAFDVVIGLVFIYLLYSLLVTIVGEIVSSKLGIRARLLRVALERMFNDGYYEQAEHSTLKLLKRWARNVLLYESSKFKGSFAGKFYEFPAIKFLSTIEQDQKGLTNLFSNTKPSYLSADYFADTLCDLLKQKGAGNTDLEKIGYTLEYNTHHIQSQSLQNLQSFYNKSEGNIELFKEQLRKWFNETMDRANGWYKQKLQLILIIIGFVLSAAFNADTIKIARILANDKEARKQLVDMGIAFSKDSASFNALHYNGDTIRPKAVMDSSLSRITKDIDAAGTILGIGWHYSNRITPSSYTVDADKDPARFKLAASCHERIDSLKQIQRLLAASLKSKQHKGDSLFQRLTLLHLDTLTINSRLQLTPASDSLKRERISLLEQAKTTTLALSLLMAEAKKDSALIADNKKAFRVIEDSLLQENFTTIDSVGLAKNSNTKMIIYGSKRYTLWNKLEAWLGDVWQNLFGLLLTALALSLGAPFWFDLLKKLVNLRGTAGVKPEEKPVKEPAEPPIFGFKAPAAVITPAPATTEEEALAQFIKATAKEPGITGIALQLKPSAALEVMVKQQNIADYLLHKYGNEYKLSNDFTIPLIYTIEPDNTLHQGITGGEIANKATGANRGTLGCFLKKQGTDALYVLSCWHVMKDNTRFREEIIQKEIVEFADGKSTTIARVVEGCLSDHPSAGIDIGIAQCLDQTVRPNAHFKINTQHRPITAFDALTDTAVQLYGKVSGLQHATIFHHTLSIQLKYEDGNLYTMNDVFSITKADKTSPTSSGDSGAVVTDMNGTPLGMIIGGNSKLSFAVKFTNIFDANKPYHQYSFHLI